MLIKNLHRQIHIKLENFSQEKKILMSDLMVFRKSVILLAISSCAFKRVQYETNTFVYHYLSMCLINVLQDYTYINS